MNLENSDTLTNEEFSKMTDLFQITEVKKFKIIDLVTHEKFEDTYKDKICYYSTRGNTIHIIGKVKFENLEPNYYIWQDVESEKDQSIANSLVKPLITDKPIRSSKIYKGIKNTGSHLHYHNFVINFLIKGKKRWFVFPQTEKNKKIVEDDGYVYRKKQRLSVSIWILRRKRLLENKLDGLVVFEQNAGEVVCLPDQWYHLVLNIEDCEGITYSW